MNESFSFDETTDEEEIIKDFDAEAQLIVQTETLPKKSADRYLLVYDTYKKWKEEHKGSLSKSEENNLIIYFKNLSQRLKASTLWSIWSMLKKTLNSRDNIDISQFYNLKSLVKNNSKGYKPKKSLALKWDEVVKFINSAPDYVYLASKVILIFGICGAARCDELSKLKTENVENLGNKYLVSINDTKNDMPRQFIIGDLFYKKVQQYVSLQPTDSFTDRFFVQYHNGKCHRQVIGRNKIGEIPQNIASYLELANPKRYTGHCFRRTAATLLSNSGANITMLKQLGGWKSTNIAQGYVDNSMKNREKIFESITDAAAFNAQSTPQPSTSKNSSTVVITTNKDGKSTPIDVECNNFPDDFEIDDEEIVAIEKSVPFEVPKSPKSPMPSFTTGKKQKILITSNSQSIRPTHFMKKPPISVFSKGLKSEPPLKRTKIEEAQTQESNETSKSLLKNSVMNSNPHVKYENCVFHGNIINNFYSSEIDYETSEKENNMR